MKNRFFLLLLILESISALTVRAQTQPVDSLVIHESERFRARQLIVPGTILGIGAFGAYSPWYMEKVNIPVRDYAQELSGGQRLRFDDYIQYIPSASFLGLGFVLPSEHDFIERVCVTATSYAAMGILVNTAKYTIREPRPDRPEARNAFPSGHTATAFMGAELVRREYGGWWGAGAYAVATTTALMRIYNNRHWTSDVLGGAAIGILSADIGFWLLPLERKLFRLDGSRRGGPGRGAGSGKALAVLPTPYGISVACVF
ncbi:MAG: phosphatase PAP2 family protein [Bacteroidales bacterium]|nr:phosphatase PAP2 family protein [Bacteroidales bacterium]